MKPYTEKLPLGENNSFIAEVYCTPHFQVGWHQHIELELIYISEGHGKSYIGNYVGEFKSGDIYFLGSNIPHMFQEDQNSHARSIVIQFRDNFLGTEFLNIPEATSLKKLFELSVRGIKIDGEEKSNLGIMISKLLETDGFRRILCLFECLLIIAQRSDYELVSVELVRTMNQISNQRLDKIMQYTIERFHEQICLKDVAKEVHMSVPAFCNYFKKSTKKTYNDLLTEIRIAHACNKLINTEDYIKQICYQSGYNTLANFNKQFFNLKKKTPSDFRRQFQNSLKLA